MTTISVGISFPRARARNAVLRIHDIRIPNPRIHASYQWIWILLYSPMTFKMPKKISAYYFLKVHLHHFSKIKSQRSHKIVGIKVFVTIFA